MPSHEWSDGHVGSSLIDRLGTRRARDAGHATRELHPLIDDIRQLLNTRMRERSDLDNYPQLRQSVFNLGVRDFTGVAFSAPEDAAASIALEIKAALQAFEPRLASVSVLPHVREGVLIFEVHARLVGSGQRGAIRVEASLESVSARFAVTG